MSAQPRPCDAVAHELAQDSIRGIGNGSGHRTWRPPARGMTARYRPCGQERSATRGSAASSSRSSGTVREVTTSVIATT